MVARPGNLAAEPVVRLAQAHLVEVAEEALAARGQSAETALVLVLVLEQELPVQERAAVGQGWVPALPKEAGELQLAQLGQEQLAGPRLAPGWQPKFAEQSGQLRP